MRPAGASGQEDSFGPGRAGQQGRSLLECFMEDARRHREAPDPMDEAQVPLVLSLKR